MSQRTFCLLGAAEKKCTALGSAEAKAVVQRCFPERIQQGERARTRTPGPSSALSGARCVAGSRGTRLALHRPGYTEANDVSKARGHGSPDDATQRCGA